MQDTQRTYQDGQVSIVFEAAYAANKPNITKLNPMADNFKAQFGFTGNVKIGLTGLNKPSAFYKSGAGFGYSEIQTDSKADALKVIEDCLDNDQNKSLRRYHINPQMKLIWLQVAIRRPDLTDAQLNGNEGKGELGRNSELCDEACSEISALPDWNETVNQQTGEVVATS